MNTVALTRKALALERDVAVSILLAAFSADPVARWMFPRDEDYARGWGAMLGDFCDVALGQNAAHLYHDGHSGAALWFPLEKKPDNDHTNDLIRELVLAEKLAIFGEMRSEMKVYEPAEPENCWYLAMIGARPECQGQGVGTRLLECGLRDVDARRVNAYLHSSNPANIPLYQRFGFKLLGKIQSGDAPALYPMFRDVNP